MAIDIEDFKTRSKRQVVIKEQIINHLKKNKEQAFTQAEIIGVVNQPPTYVQRALNSLMIANKVVKKRINFVTYYTVKRS